MPPPLLPPPGAVPTLVRLDETDGTVKAPEMTAGGVEVVWIALAVVLLAGVITPWELPSC